MLRNGLCKTSSLTFHACELYLMSDHPIPESMLDPNPTLFHIAVLQSHVHGISWRLKREGRKAIFVLGLWEIDDRTIWNVQTDDMNRVCYNSVLFRGCGCFGDIELYQFHKTRMLGKRALISNCLWIEGTYHTWPRYIINICAYSARMECSIGPTNDREVRLCQEEHARNITLSRVANFICLRSTSSAILRFSNEKIAIIPSCSQLKYW